MFDILIKNGTVIDGTGKPGYIADVAIKTGKIVKIGELHEERAGKEIDAEGKIICPGFIDVNNHSDTSWQIFSNPNLESLLYQGVATIIGGTCGYSLAPLVRPETIRFLRRWVDIGKINFNWLSIEEYLDLLSGKKLSLNYSTLVGYTMIKKGIIGDDIRSLNPKEIKFLEKLLEKSLDAGALGLSLELPFYSKNGGFKDEVMNFAKICAKFGAVLTIHIHDEGGRVSESVEEVIEIAKESGAKVHISHLKVMGSKNWHKMDEILKIIDGGKRNGQEISFDIYPYTSISSVLYSFLPGWVSEGGEKMMIKRLSDKATQKKVLEEMKDSEFEYGKIEIAESALDRTLTRRTIEEIAFSQGKEVEEAVIDILLASEGRVTTSAEVLSSENIDKAILHPLSIIASNGSGYSEEYSRSGAQIHSRCFGTFSKIIEDYVILKKKLTLEEAIKKMTDFPARKFGLEKRGRLENNFWADILIFDKNKIESPASQENPYQYSKGIEYFLINGKISINEEKYLKERSGQIIKR